MHTIVSLVILLILISGCTTPAPPIKQLEVPEYTIKQIDEYTVEHENGIQYFRREFESWVVKKTIDPMDSGQGSFHVCSNFRGTHPSPDSQFFFRVISSSGLLAQPGPELGDEWWPHCEFDHITYKVDGGNLEVMPQAIPANKGSCRGLLQLDNSFLDDLYVGRVMQLKANNRRGLVDLVGLEDALNYARSGFKYPLD